MIEKPDLASLLGSRICHDLISPIGAIGNGVELMQMEGARHSPEMSLIADSVAHANAKIRFFRLALGAAQGEHVISRTEVLQVLSDNTAGTRLQISLQSPAKLPRASVKLALLLVMCLETALPYGGTIEILQGEDRWTMLGRADRLRIDPPLWGHLTSGGGELNPSQVQFALVREELRRQHRRLTTEITEHEVRFTF